MRQTLATFTLFAATLLLAACGRDEMAALEDHRDGYYGHETLAGAMPVHGTYKAATQAPAAAAIAVSSQDLAKPGNATSADKSSTLAKAKPGSWAWPLEGKITARYGTGDKEGVIIAAAEGTPIHAAQRGEVIFVGQDAHYGNMVILRHAGGLMTAYSHASSVLVQKGDSVTQGQVIANVGHTGEAKADQLHFAMRDGAHSIDPLSKLPSRVAENVQ